MIKDALAAYNSASGDEVCLRDLNTSQATVEVELEKAIVASEERLVVVETLIHELERSANSVDELVTKIDPAEARLKRSEQHSISKIRRRSRAFRFWKWMPGQVGTGSVLLSWNKRFQAYLLTLKASLSSI